MNLEVYIKTIIYSFINGEQIGTLYTKDQTRNEKKYIVSNAEFLTDQSPIVNLFAGKFEAFNLSGVPFPLFGIAFLFLPVTEFPSFMALATAFA